MRIYPLGFKTDLQPMRGHADRQPMNRRFGASTVERSSL